MKRAVAPIQVRVGVPLAGGQLVAAARGQGYPVLFSANAFAKTHPKGHEREGEFRGWKSIDATQFAGLDAALDSAGFVAAVRYRDYRWTVRDYYDLVEAHPWTWHAAMDYCCEPEVAGDRGIRLLRIGATAFMLGQCQAEARRRGLPMPMPVLQGWTPEEYAMCAQWLPLRDWRDWPELVGIGSVCRRHVDGENGILAILDAVDQVLPKHVRLHMFGVKSTALAQLAGHPRVASVDSMAWDVQARAERRTGRDMTFRISHMHRWAERQQATAARGGQLHAVQTSLFEPADFGVVRFSDNEAALLELLAFRYAELVATGELEYLAAGMHAQRDAHQVIGILHCNPEIDDEVLEMLGDAVGDVDEVIEALAAVKEQREPEWLLAA